MNNRKATVVDYDMGNLFSIEKAIDYVGGIADITGDPARIAKADRLVLPGVGAFGSAKQRLEEQGIADAINEFARTQRPLLGICLGMQLLFSEGHEFGHHEGLGLIEGKVVRFKDPNPEGPRFKIPQIGWTEIELPELNKISTNTEWNPTARSSLTFLTSFLGVSATSTAISFPSITTPTSVDFPFKYHSIFALCPAS